MRIGQATLTVAFVFGLFPWSPSADAQQPTKIPRIGVLSDESPLLGASSFGPLAAGLRDLGYVEGQNVAFERRYASEKNELLPNLAAELVGLQPDVIFAIGTRAASAVKSATQTIPIIFARISDPIGFGLVSSLARPGGNLTGVSIQTRELAAKRLELLITAAPDAKRVGALWDPNFPPAGPLLKEIEGAARSLNLELAPMAVRSPDDFEPALRAMVEQRVDALIVVNSTIFSEDLHRLPDLTVEARLPATFSSREAVVAGGLMSYGPNYPDMYRRAAVYVDKILKGAKPADLPVEQPTRFELVINLKTAKALGLTIPLSLLGRADEVIE
jgi:putative ABC transport system substrate-binding protein